MQHPTTPHRPPIAQAVALETVRLGSAGLSASYYAMLGLIVHPAAAAGLGVIAFALDYTKAPVMRAAAEGPGIARRIAAAAVFTALFLASMIAVDGTLMKLRSEWSGGRQNTMSEYDRAEAAYTAAEAELVSLGSVRTPEAVKASMEAAPVKRNVFVRTKECTDITVPESFNECSPILKLRQEMAGAIRKVELEQTRDAAKATLDNTERPTAADPQADVMAKALEPYGLSAALVAYLMVSVVGFAIELVACFGMWILGHRRTVAIRTVVQSEKPSNGGPDKPRRTVRKAAIRTVVQSGTVVPFDKDRARADLMARLARSEVIPSQDALAATWNRPKTTVSDWLRAWEAEGVIPARRAAGRRKMLATNVVALRTA